MAMRAWLTRLLLLVGCTLAVHLIQLERCRRLAGGTVLRQMLVKTPSELTCQHPWASFGLLVLVLVVVMAYLRIRGGSDG